MNESESGGSSEPGVSFPHADSTLINPAGNNAPPSFGLLDVIEAFTAMRHEMRGQTIESRTAADSVRQAVSAIQQLESRLLVQVSENMSDDSRQLARILADTDHQLTRAIDALKAAAVSRQSERSAAATQVRQFFDGMSPGARWFSRRLLNFILKQEQQQESGDQLQRDPALEGLSMVLARLRRTMKDCQIERIDTLGQPFDPGTMNAIGTTDGREFPAGHVGEQLSPGYRWRGQLLQYADVRVIN